jgi:hypothetical protein
MQGGATSVPSSEESASSVPSIVAPLTDSLSVVAPRAVSEPIPTIQRIYLPPPVPVLNDATPPKVVISKSSIPATLTTPPTTVNYTPRKIHTSLEGIFKFTVNKKSLDGSCVYISGYDDGFITRENLGELLYSRLNLDVTTPEECSFEYLQNCAERASSELV